jgi:hypothetical protein
MKTGCSLAEFSKEGYDPKSAALPMMMTMMIVIYIHRQINNITTQARKETTKGHT